MKMLVTKTDAVKELMTYDHCYLSPLGALRIVKPFGLTELRMQKRRANTGEFKGLTVSDVGPHTIVEGYDARDLAVLLCEREGVDPALYLHGRGSGLEQACQNLLKHLASVEKAAV